jgi:NNP family nitrate/nitrite transporter-like MFS transporter
MAIVTVLWFLFMKNSKKETPSAEAGIPAVKMGESLRHSLRSPGVWICALCLMCIFGGAITLSALLPAALVSRGISAASAGGYTSFIMLGSIIGCFLSPVLVAKLGHKVVLFFCALIASAGIAFGWLVPQGLILSIVMIIVGITYGGAIPLLVSIPIQLKEIGQLMPVLREGFWERCRCSVQW